ncbi:MAG TPA: SAM-dependent methyltransferase [Erythrobacter sp.]|nr:SAM-dependent methyltransferase [Erythrobacter sp.]
MEARRLSRDRASHWEAAYTDKQAEEQSWYQQEPTSSLKAISRIGGQPHNSLIDVGAGSSALLLNLFKQGWYDLTALDISSAGLARAQTNAGEFAAKIDWIRADITQWKPARHLDIWHDRAAFHFLTEADDRARYKAALMAGLRPGGYLIVATFAPDAPEKCSGLPVCRYDAAGIDEALGDAFDLIAEWRDVHHTPWGTSPAFNWCVFEKDSS